MVFEHLEPRRAERERDSDPGVDQWLPDVLRTASASGRIGAVALAKGSGALQYGSIQP